VWKLQNFSVTRILRENNFGDSRSAKSAILTHLKALNFDFCVLFALFGGWKIPNQQNSKPLKWAKMAVLQLQTCLKLISRKNLSGLIPNQQNSQSPFIRLAKMAVLQLLYCLKLIWRKILSGRKIFLVFWKRLTGSYAVYLLAYWPTSIQGQGHNTSKNYFGS